MVDNLFLNQLFQPIVALKIVFLIIILLYAIFTIVVFTQVNTMNGIVTEVHSSFVLKLIALINILLAISLFVFAVVIL